jgi:hypothetical protein
LATASHETGDAATKYPVGDPRFLAEAGSDSYFSQYANVSGIGNNGRKDWAVRYKGRGYLQITPASQSGGYGNQVAIALKLPGTGETVFMTFSHGQDGSFVPSKTMTLEILNYTSFLISLCLHLVYYIG